ncbi:hypothetical protein [Tenacibaculum insulae]|uniref:hypothetical protein n=1 Tax=Tenacibaculum insulae TaxID=2029677 RepID=UPI003AB15D52
MSFTRLEDEGVCTVAITTTTTNLDAGESTTEYYYSTSRVSEADRKAGAKAILENDFLRSSDFKQF